MKKRHYIISAFLVLFLLLIGSGIKSEAATVQTLKSNTTYTKPLTGTAKHKIKYTQVKSGSYYKNLKLMIDNKTVRNISGKKDEVMSYNVYLLTVAKKRTLIAVIAHSDSGLMPFMNLYEYKNKKLTFLVDFGKLSRSSNYEKADKLLTPWARCKIRSVSTNQIILSWVDQTPATGNIAMNIAYKISGSSVKRVGLSSEIRLSTSNMNHPQWTVNRPLSGRSVLISQNYDFHVEEGDKVTLFAMTVQSGRRYMLLVDKDGNKGWVPVPFSLDEDKLKKVDSSGKIIWGYFKECKFVG